MDASHRILPDPSLSFLQVLARRAAETPDEIAFTEVTLDGMELEEHPHRYGAILDVAVRYAGALAARGVAEGDRVLLSVARPDAFLSAFLAIQGLGAIPVPMPAEADFPKRALFMSRLTTVAESCRPSLVIIETASDEPSSIPSITLTELEAHEPASGATDKSFGSDRPTPTPAELHLFSPTCQFFAGRHASRTAFLQYTSGSTGAPKGVVVTQDNLVANLRAITLGARMTERDASVSWLPIFHDMGLIGGFLLGLYLHLRCYVMSPRTFIARPDAWLRAIDRFGGTFTVAPNFAYHLLAKRLPDFALQGLSLGTLRLAFDGAEPIDPATARAFTRRFAAVGLSGESFFPVYGMAECTLAAAFPEPSAPTRVDHIDRRLLADRSVARATDSASASAVSFVSVGRAVPDHRIRILAIDTDDELPERHVGEVAISGPSVSPGYFGDTRPPVRELRSGDLGYIAEGELFLVDRLKDLVIVAGRNHVPSDIERVATQVEGVKVGSVVAFSSAGDSGTEELCLVVATDDRAFDRDAVTKRLRVLLHETFSLVPREIRFVRKGEIPKTSSGKIQRSLCRRLYEDGRLGMAPAA